MENNSVDRTVLETGVVKTTKIHKCWGCGNEIPPSDKVLGTLIKDGEVEWTCYWCNVCHAYLLRHKFDHRYASGIGFKGIIKTDKREWENVRGALNSLENSRKEIGFKNGRLV